MTKKIMFCFSFIFHLVLSAQTVYLKTGKNYTDFKFIQSDGTQSTSLKKGVGDAYEIGYKYTLFDEEGPLSYEVGLTFNEYRALVGIKSNYITWETNYLGIQGSVLYSFINQDYYSIGVKVGANASKIVYGIENVDGILYDIKSTEDFKGFLFQYVIGLDAKYNVADGICIGLGYNLMNSLNASKSNTNKFFINNSQINAGIYFDIDN